MRAGIVTLARIIGRKFGVRVVVDPKMNTAATDGKAIYIPPLDLSSQEDTELLEGLIDHEAMHCRLTDFTQKGKTALEDAMANIFEDVWGETDFAGIYPGTRRTIRRAAEIMESRGIIGGKLDGSEHPAQLVGAVLVNGLRSRVLGQDCLEDAYLHNHELLKQAVGEPLAANIWETALEVRGVHSTREAYVLAARILDLIKDEQQQQQNQQQQQQQAGGDGQGDSQSESGDSQSSGSGQSGNQEQEGNGKGSGAGESSENGEGQGQGQGGEQGEGGTDNGSASGNGKQGSGEPGGESGPGKTGSGSSSGNAAGSGSGQVDPEHLAETLEAIGKILGASLDEFGKTDLGQIVEEAVKHMPKIDMEPPKIEKPRLSDGWDSNIVPRVRMLRNSLAARLTHLFDTQEETQVWLDKSGRRLDTARLSAVPTGQQHVFRKLEYGEEVSVEVSLVVDCSGSMKRPISPMETRMEAAQAVTVALGDVLDMHDIPFAVTLYARSVCAYKSTGDSWRVAKRNIVDLVESGSTKTGHAVLEGSKDIMFSDRERRIMLVVTDGIPDDVEFAVSESAEIQKTGVEVRYVMIGGDHEPLSRALTAEGIHWSCANSPEDLAKAVFEAVEPRLALRAAA